jgi:hypothetical protein
MVKINKNGQMWIGMGTWSKSTNMDKCGWEWEHGQNQQTWTTMDARGCGPFCFVVKGPAADTMDAPQS